MMLGGKVAVVHGAGGAIGSAVADAFEHAGARVFRASRRSRPGVASVHAMDESEIVAHAASVVDQAGRIDIAFNAVGVDAVRGVPLLELGYDDLLTPITRSTRSQFLTSRAAARHMVARGEGVVLTLAVVPGGLAAGSGGLGVASAAIEQLTRTLAEELAPTGVRVACVRARHGEPLERVARAAVAAARSLTAMSAEASIQED